MQKNEHRFGLDNLEGNLIWANLQLGNFAQAREIAFGFGQRARRTGKQAELLYSLQSLGQAEIGLEQWQAGEGYLVEALKLAVAINNRVRQVLIRQQLGKLCIRQAAYDQAIIHFQDALHCAQTTGQSDLHIVAQAGLALTHLRQGKLVQARRAVEPVLTAEKAITPDHPDYSFIGMATYQVLATQRDPRAAAILKQLAHEIGSQAAKIKDAAQRRSFLENIPEHREIVALQTATPNNRFTPSRQLMRHR